MQNHKKVISDELNIPQQQWTFWDYVVNENNKIEVWYQELSEGARHTFDGVLKNISKTQLSNEWSGWRGFLQGKYKQERIWELGFKEDKIQHRVLGVFGGQRKQAVLLVGCYHKQRNYTPSDALETAFKRAKQYRVGGVQLHERKIKTDL